MMLYDSFDASGTYPCDRHPLIDLDPADWCWATWRKRPQLVRPEPQPFELEVAIAKLKKVKRLKSRHWQWEACEIPVSMSIEEAIFWYAAITKVYQFDRVRDLVKQCETKHLAAPVEIAEIQEWFTLVESNYAPAQMTVILSYFLSIEQLLDKLTEYRQYQLFMGFRQHILPYLNETEFAAIKTYIRANWEPQRFYFRPHLSALLGIYDWLEALVAKWKPERSYAAFDRNFRLEVIFGLESADLVVHHVHRLRLRLGTAEQVRAWLAHTELTALELVTESIAALNSNKEVSNAAEMFDVLTLIRSPLVAPQILALVQRSRIRDRAQQWLEENLELSITGLLPLTIQKHPLRETAIAWLRMMQRQGFGDLIREKMSDEYQQIELQIFDAPQREELGKTPKWFKAIVDAAPKLEPLDWVKVSDLPAIVVGDTRLSTTHHQAILNLLQADPDNCSSILRQHTNADSLSQFVWQLYEQWSLKKPKGRADWVILALGRLGDDEILLKLADLIRAWCKASKHQLATSGIAALTLHASETAIYQLMQFAYPPISRLIRPEQALDEIAKARNLSRRQLEDCAMREVLERHCTTIANSGSPRKRRPKTHQTQLSKTQLKQFLTLQSLRFEQQMIHRAAYTVAEFQSFVFHPIVRPMAQSLIWQAKSMCFRIAEDGTLADSSDMPVELSSEAEIYLPHPLEMPDRSTWAELLSDYELIPPFAQVNRPIYSVSTQEQDATIVTRFADRGVFTVNLTQSLMKLGWTETYIGRGHWRGYCKRFRADHTAAILSVSEMPREHGYQRIDRIFFVANDWDGRRVPTERDRIPLTTVAPLVFSEVLREIDHLTHRSKKRHA